MVTCYIYQKAFCRLHPSCAKTPSNGSPDRTAHGLASSNQRSPRRDVKIARQKPPVLAYKGAGPFNFTISHNSAYTNSITSVLGLNDGKTCTLYTGTSALFLRRVLSKSHSIPNPNLGCPRYRAKSFTYVLKRPDLARPVNYRAHLANPFSG